MYIPVQFSRVQNERFSAHHLHISVHPWSGPGHHGIRHHLLGDQCHHQQHIQHDAVQSRHHIILFWKGTFSESIILIHKLFMLYLVKVYVNISVLSLFRCFILCASLQTL